MGPVHHHPPLPRRDHHPDPWVRIARATTSRPTRSGGQVGAGFVPDEPHLFEYLTVEEHPVRGSTTGAAIGMRLGVLRELELEDRRRSLPEELWA